MASGIFAVLDDIAALMDDVAVTTKLATTKTAGILGDDLAVNAEKATGFLASREIPVLWEITKGSFLNKLIIIPIALTLSYFLPIAITVILVLGGCYLAYEGVEKIIEFLFHKKKEAETVVQEIEQDKSILEKQKIKSAITTDFILSIEIVIIALGTVMNETLPIKILTVTIVAIIATVGVYGIVAVIVRLDDIGYQIIKRAGDNKVGVTLGKLLVKSLPVIIRILSIVGTVALLLVSGGLFIHNIDTFHHLLPNLPFILKELIFGLAIGLIVFIILTASKAIYRSFKPKKQS